jgi:hypothetical protein
MQGHGPNVSASAAVREVFLRLGDDNRAAVVYAYATS